LNNTWWSSKLDAFLYDSNVLDYLASRDDGCMLRNVGNPYAMTGYGIAVAKQNRMLPKINNQILEYLKNGQMQRWKKFWLAGACKKETGLRNSNKKLGVKNFISAFILLLCGILLCSILLMLEHLFYRFVRPRVRNMDKYGCCGLISLVSTCLSTVK
ncbi:Glutamate receptor ionotropic, NMDA 2B, partial [Cichlidogyrus casuarinus]